MAARAPTFQFPWLWLTLVVFAAAYLCLLGARPLMSPDEGRYAEISREMLTSGDWITPHLNGYLYFEKPPLQYWTTAVAYGLFGLNEWSARLWNALMYLGAAVAIGWCAARRHGLLSAQLSVLVYFGMALPFVLGQVNTLDPGVAAFLTTALCAFIVAQRPGVERGESRIAMLLCWAAMGGAVLSKGLIGFVLPGAALGLYLLATRQWRVLARMQWIAGLALFALITVPWFVLIERRNPGFAHFFFIREHLERYLTTVHERIEPWWYFLLVVVCGSLPWTLAWAGALLAGLRERGSEFRVRLFLALWVLLVIAFFSVSHSKLIGYVLPVFPVLALLVGERGATDASRGFKSAALLALGFWLICLIASFVAGPALLQRFTSAETAWVEWVLRIGSIIGVVLAVLAMRAYSLGAQRSGWRVLGMAQVAALLFLVAAASPYAQTRSSKPLISAARAEFARASDVYSIGDLDQSLPFYLRRTVILVDFINEFEFGMSADPSRASLSLEKFRQRWLAAVSPIAVIDADRVRDIEALGIPARIIFRNRQAAVMVR